MKTLTWTSPLVLTTCLATGCGGERSATDLVNAAPPPDWYAIRYGGGPGCGLYVQLFGKDGQEVTDNGKRIGFFPGGASPTTARDTCLQYCAEWEALRIVTIVTKRYESSLGLTHVTATCYLKGERIAGVKLLWPN